MYILNYKTHLHNSHQRQYNESTAGCGRESVYWNTLVACWHLKYIEHYPGKLGHFQYQRRHFCVLCHLHIHIKV